MEVHLSKPRKYWISCNKFTVQITCDRTGRIIEAAPIVRKFIGQYYTRLTRWASGFGGFIIDTLE
jgi:hypothetical protein